MPTGSMPCPACNGLGERLLGDGHALPCSLCRSAGEVRRFAVQVEGHDSAEFYAHSPGAARYRAWRSIQIAGYRITFRDFLRKARVLQMGLDHA